MKLKNGYEKLTLDVLENKDLGMPEGACSRLVNRCLELRKIPLNRFTVEDLRLIILQEFALDYLIPLAIKVLKNDLLAEGDFHPGDLLNSVLKVNADFWKLNKDLWRSIDGMIIENSSLLTSAGIKTEKFCAIEMR